MLQSYQLDKNDDLLLVPLGAFLFDKVWMFHLLDIFFTNKIGPRWYQYTNNLIALWYQILDLPISFLQFFMCLLVIVFLKAMLESGQSGYRKNFTGKQ